MEEKILIEIDGKDYPVKPPSIRTWAMLDLLETIEAEEDYTLMLVSSSTGIDEDLLKQANFLQVKQAADYLTKYFLELGEKFYSFIDFKDKRYKFLDLNKMSFGHFIDIDSFLQKDESYRKSNMNELMAMLYMEEGEEKYDVNKVLERTELFKDLEIKYLHGSFRFFFLLRKRLQKNTPYYLKIKWKVKRILKPLVQFGAGMGRLFSWLVKTLRTWRK
tara:strand:+ start:294 stop:947 length:654 start_codon:yes stop_codon:yes gene_type:complete